MPGSHQDVPDISVNKAEQSPSLSLHWVGGIYSKWSKNVTNWYILCKKKENATKMKELGVWIIILMRVLRGSLIERAQDLKELRSTMEISGGDPSKQKEWCQGERLRAYFHSNEASVAGGEEVVWRSFGQKCSCQPDYLSF